MAIKLKSKKTDVDLAGCSKIWGFPDLPDSVPYPEVEVEVDGEKFVNPLTFICQIRCQDLVPVDRQGLLPHTGMLYFFGDVDYFLGLFEYDSPGMGEWGTNFFRVLYSPTCDDLHSHKLVDESGALLGLPAESLSFEECEDKDDGFKLLGRPYFDEVDELYPDWTSLLQLDCSDEWNLQFYDSGMLNFLMRGNEIRCYLHSF